MNAARRQAGRLPPTERQRPQPDNSGALTLLAVSLTTALTSAIIAWVALFAR
ncbi:MAG: hypothetical protein H6707_01790 [Deltaproteobacteria bacterium]|nr:hypothetical protein [Deltaproteobacteria bacterium]